MGKEERRDMPRDGPSILLEFLGQRDQELLGLTWQFLSPGRVLVLDNMICKVERTMKTMMDLKKEGKAPFHGDLIDPRNCARSGENSHRRTLVDPFTRRNSQRLMIGDELSALVSALSKCAIFEMELVRFFFT